MIEGCIRLILGVDMSIFSLNFMKLILFLNLDNLSFSLYNWKILYFCEIYKFYRPITVYNLFFFIFSIIFDFVPKYFYFILNKSSNIYLFVNFFYFKSFINFLKNSMLLNYNYLADIVVVDYPNRNKRFELIYNLVSINTLYYSLDRFFSIDNSFFCYVFNSRLFLKMHVLEFQSVFSLNEFYFSSVWLERKNWDFFGIFFFGNKDLRRIFLDYGFIGYPLRKDFPLVGYYELFYDDLEKLIYIEPVEVSQEMRFFNFLSPWENFYVFKIK